MLQWTLLGLLGLVVLYLSWRMRARARFDAEVRRAMLSLKHKAGAGDEVFSQARIAGLPEPVRRFLGSAMAEGAHIPSSADFHMEGEIKLNPRAGWKAFSAREVLAGRHGFVWDARVKAGLLRVRGVDSYLEHRARMRVWIAGIFEIIDAKSDDITRSTAGRLASELAWAPGILLGMEGVRWSAPAADEVVAAFEIDDEGFELHVKIDDAGAARELWLNRWSINVDPEGPNYLPFGASVSAQGSFEGYTIAGEMEGGWNYGTEKYEPFIRLTLTGADFR